MTVYDQYIQWIYTNVRIYNGDMLICAIESMQNWDNFCNDNGYAYDIEEDTEVPQ